MPKLAPHVLPAYRRHKQSGQAVVTLNGRDHLLGRYRSPESREAYQRVTGQWLAAGRQTPREQAPLTVVELLAAFWRHAQTYYRKPDGTPTSEAENYRQAMVPLRETYGRTPAAEFGPLALKTVRDNMVARGWVRTNVNKQVSRIKSIFRWAAENELIPGPSTRGSRPSPGSGAAVRGRGGASDPRPPDAEGDRAVRRKERRRGQANHEPGGVTIRSCGRPRPRR